MESVQKNNKEYYVIDFAHILKFVWNRIWVVVVASLLVAALMFSMATFFIAPKYSSQVMLYVNNSSFSVSDIGFSISSSEISAAQSLLKTYTVILKNRTTLERVKESAKVSYDWEELYDMIEASSVEETEVMGVTVTCNNPYEAKRIANGIAIVLPERISEIVEGSSMEVVDSAVVNTDKVSPSITKYTAIGFLIGAFVSLVVLIIFALLDNTIHNDEYVTSTYNYPILAKIPDLLDVGAKKYGYYKSKNGTAK